MIPSPEALRAHYTAFLDSGRILLTGHSHQAWPDVAKVGILKAFNDASVYADDKWGLASEQADAVRDAVADSLGAVRDEIALGQSSHELVTRFLSALDLRRRPHIVTTTGEFHSMRRQLMRLAEEGVEVTWVPVEPARTLTQRVADAVREDTAAVMMSTVLFQTSRIVPDVVVAVEAAHRRGAYVLLDTYHAFSVVPQGLADWGGMPVFVTAGGYKYAQWGEGVCWLRVPSDCALRPCYTGWFSDFAGLDGPQDEVRYGPTPATRFAGSTYDPISHYRAAAVVDFFQDHGMTTQALRQRSLSQTQRIIEALPFLELITPRADAERGGFVAFRVADASGLVSGLRERDVVVDSRGDIIRFGPAPYTTNDEIDRATAEVRSLLNP
jgi:kynureninase